MKSFKTTLLTIACAAFGLLAPGRAWAGPANPKHVAADAKWFVHLDIEAAKQTTVYRQVLDAVQLQFPVEATCEQLKAFIGINPLTDITGVTVYNNSFEKDVAGIIIYANYDRNLLVNAIASNPSYKQTDYNNCKLETWTDENDGKNKAGCFFDEHTLVMADKLDSVKLVVDVLSGKKPGGSALVVEPGKGVFLYGTADLAQAGDANISQLLSNSEAAIARASEVEGQIRLALTLTAKTAEVATKLNQMAQGLKALGELATGNMPTLANLIRQVQVTVEGAKVTATVQHDAKTILQTLQQLDAENKAKAAAK